MLVYIGRRLLIWVPSLLFILLVIYALAFYGAGDPVKLIFMRAPGDVAYDPARVEAIREAAGLNRPFIVQFGAYVLNLLQGDFGNSLVSGRSVGSMIAAAAPVSLQLGLITIVVTAVLGIPLGLISGLREGRASDTIITSVSLFLWAIPPYVMGPLLMVALIVFFPSVGLPTGWGGVFDFRIILPVAVLSLQPIALIQRQTRTAVLEILSENFVRTALAKGVTPMKLALHHILRPILTPIVTQLGIILITFINGAVFVEVVFGLPGLGRLTVRAMTDADYPIILAVTLIGAIGVLAANLIVDVLYPLIDPRADGDGR